MTSAPAGDSQPSGSAPLGQLELRCPPLPGTLMEALDLLDRPEDMTVSSVTGICEHDPAVVARLLQTVNSAYYGVRRSITNIERAVVMLGPVSVTGLMVGMNMLKLRALMEGPAADTFSRLIQHSLATGFLTRELTRWMGRDNRHIEDSYTAGLLHDFGKIILVYNHPEQAVAFYDEKALDSHLAATSRREAEQLLFGCDHTEAGQFASRKLNFPDVLVEVIRHHHDPEQSRADGRVKRLLKAVQIANDAAKAMGYAFVGESDKPMHADEERWTTFVRQETPRLGDADGLAGRFLELQEELDQYVEHIIAAGEQAQSDPEAVKRKLRQQGGRGPLTR